MGREIERKFTVHARRLDLPGPGSSIRQGYLAIGEEISVRVRIRDDSACLTVKGGRGPVRDEYEYPIPLADAGQMLERYCRGSIVEKTRYLLPADGMQWEIDVFEGANAGLVLAEIELESIDTPVYLPDWIDTEVTDDSRYANASLSSKPFTTWG